MNQITKLIIVLLFVFLLAPMQFVQASDTFGFNSLNLGSLQQNIEPKAAAVNIVNLVLGFLGLVAIVIILIGGFKWMTAGGSEEKVSEAKKLLIAGLIGLAIIMLAWGISTWVVGSIYNVSSS